MSREHKITVDIVVPVYAGENYLERLVEAVRNVREVISTSDRPYSLSQLIFVDDGAIDASGSLVERLATDERWIKVVHLSRNFGQHPATIAGILNSSADWVVTMDEDLQHPPSRIDALLGRAVCASFDVVYGSPATHVHGGFFRDLSSRLFKLLMDRITGDPIIRKANSFRLIRGDLARAASGTCGPDTYLDIALSWYTSRIDTVKMQLSDERHIQDGSSGYTLRRLFSHARRLAISSQVRTLRLAAFVGTAFFLFSLLGAVLLMLAQFFTDATREIQGWTSLFLLISLLNGIVLMILGIATEYISLLVLRAHGKPTFFIIDRSSDAALAEYFTRIDIDQETKAT